MGFAAIGNCFGTRDDALAAMCSKAYFGDMNGVHRCVAVVGTGSVSSSTGTMTFQSTTLAGANRGSGPVPVTLTACSETMSANFPWNLSIIDGGLIAAAIVGCWIIGWGYKALSFTLLSDGESIERN